MDLGGIQRLRSQRLYRAAENECIKALNQVQLTQSQSALLTVELLRTYSGLALDSKSDQRKGIWPKAENFVRQFDRRFDKNPYAAIVHLQHGTLLNLKAKMERIENKVQGELGYRSAKRFARDAIRSLDATLEEIAAIRPSSSANSGLTSSQITQLRHKTRRELGLAHENYSQCFDRESDDEVSELAQSAKHFESLARLKSFPKLASESQLHLARCQRLLGNFSFADKLLSHLETGESHPPQTKMATAAERTHYYLDQGNFQAGMRTSETVFPVTGVDAPTIAEYELAKLRALVLICKRNNEPQNSPRRQRVNQIASDINERFSLYWKTRAEDHLALIRPNAVSAVTGLERKAMSAFRAGRIDESLGLFVEAAQFAEKNGDLEKSLQLMHTAGAVAHQSKRFHQARELLRDAAVRFKTQTQAAEAHLLAIVDAAQVARSQNAVDVKVYSDLLSEHLRLWPRSTTSNQVRSWFGKLLFRQRKWREALDAFIRINPASSELETNFESIQFCCYQILDSASSESRIAEQSRIDDLLSAITERTTEANTQGLLRMMTKVELLRIAVSLEATVGSPTIEKRLQDIASAFPSDAIGIEATRCLALYYCNNRRFHDAKGFLNEISLIDSQNLFRFLNHVFQSIQSVSSQLKTNSADVLISVASELLNRDLSRSKRQRTRIILANAHQFAGRRADAISLARQLEKEEPQNGEIHELLATLLQESVDPQELAKAIQEWRAVANRSKPGSDRWFRSKLSIAECYYRTNQHQKAADVIRLTQALHPDLGGDQLKLRFQDLLRKASRAAGQ